MLVIALISSGMSLLFSLLIHVQHRRSGRPVPAYQVSATTGCIGLFLVLASMLEYFEETVAMMLVVVASGFSIVSAALSFRARRQRSGTRPIVRRPIHL